MENKLIKKPLRVLIWAFIVVFGSVSFVFPQKATKIELLGANSIDFDQNISNGARRLIGNVSLKQDNVRMFCDSAHLFIQDNTFDAFGKVHLTQSGEQQFDVYSTYLHHLGNEKIAQFRNDVLMTNGSASLRTQAFDYNLREEKGYYTLGGTIVDSSTTLTSTTGYYFTKERKFIFSNNVYIENTKDKFTLRTDTLHYYARIKSLYFFGPTYIENDTNKMYAEYGWYNTERQTAHFEKNVVYQNTKQKLTSQKLDIDRKFKIVCARDNAVFTDDSNHMVAKGDYLYFRDTPHKLILTQRAQIIYISGTDSLFIHADTITSELDTGGVFKIVKAFHHVKLYRKDFQLKCDSLSFTEADSIMRIFGEPVLWNQENQITAQYMTLTMKNGKPHQFNLTNSSLIIAKVDSLRFNQISGKNMVGFLKNNQLYKIKVLSMAESIYYAIDNEGLLGVNFAQSKDMTIYLDDQQINRVVLIDSPKGIMKPPDKTDDKETKLKNFNWLERYRPKSPRDIFKWE